MSLLTEAATDFAIMERTENSDGEGGYEEIWSESGNIKCAVSFDTSIQSRIAAQSGVTSRYTITTDRDVVLKHHDVIKRLTDGKVFRITSDGDDKYTPISATLNMRQVTAEEWQIP